MGMGMRGGDKESQRAEEVRPETDGCGWVGGGWVGGVGRGTEGLQPGLVIGWMVGPRGSWEMKFGVSGEAFQRRTDTPV